MPLTTNRVVEDARYKVFRRRRSFLSFGFINCRGFFSGFFQNTGFTRTSVFFNTILKTPTGIKFFNGLFGIAMLANLTTALNDSGVYRPRPYRSRPGFSAIFAIRSISYCVIASHAMLVIFRNWLVLPTFGAKCR